MYICRITRNITKSENLSIYYLHVDDEVHGKFMRERERGVKKNVT